MQNPSSAEKFLYQPAAKLPDAVQVAWVYPANYNIGMSSLGYLGLFRQMDETAGILPVRVFADTAKQYRATDFELAGFSFSFELDIFGVFDFLNDWQLPFSKADRSEAAPLLFAGGPVIMTNPEPYAEVFDFFLIGEGEDLLTEVMAVCKRTRHLSKVDRLLALAREVVGVYVPGLYTVDYHSLQTEEEGGAIAGITPTQAGLPMPIEKRLNTAMDSSVMYTPILTPNTVFSDTFLVEVVRGCAHRCRFCLASYSMLPARSAGLDAIRQAIDMGLQHTPKIGLLGALIADHPQFDELCQYLQNKMEATEHTSALQLSSASLRADTLTPHIAETFRQGGQKNITLAIESGSETLRRRINKNLKQADIFKAAETVAAAGIPQLKLYGMVGLPDETDEDVLALAELVRVLKKQHPTLKIVLGCSSFVPKAATPFQWQPRPQNKLLEKRFALLQKSLARVADFRPSSLGWDKLQAILSRGDRRLYPFIETFYRSGRNLGAVNRAWKQLKQNKTTDTLPGLDWYALRERPQDEILPWDLLALGVSKEILYKEGQSGAMQKALVNIPPA